MNVLVFGVSMVFEIFSKNDKGCMITILLGDFLAICQQQQKRGIFKRKQKISANLLRRPKFIWKQPSSQNRYIILLLSFSFLFYLMKVAAIKSRNKASP